MATTRRSMRIVIASLTVAFLHVATPAASEEPPPIRWHSGPMTADLGGFAELDLPEGFLFADKAGTLKLLELTHNLASGEEVGAIVPAGEDSTDSWFVVFEFSDVGYVKDDEKNKIDPNALLSSIRENTNAANEERRRKGWHTFTVDGWERPPYYDTETHNLTWAIRGTNNEGSTSINHSVRILGRRGTMNVDLVQDPQFYAASVPRFESVMNGFRFKQGSRYADFVKGDRTAAYGLTALIAGGAGAIAVKTGLLAKSWKLIVGLLLMLKKALIVAVLALIGFIRSLWARITGRSTAKVAGTEQGPPDPTG